MTKDKGRFSKSDQTSGDLRHTERLVTVASFRTWRGSRTSVAQSPKSDIVAPAPRDATSKLNFMVTRAAGVVDPLKEKVKPPTSFALGTKPIRRFHRLDRLYA